jgi:hypothetical protein
VGDIEFQVISITENSNKLQKTMFWKEKIMENLVIFEGLPSKSSMRKLGCAFGIVGKITMNII